MNKLTIPRAHTPVGSDFVLAIGSLLFSENVGITITHKPCKYQSSVLIVLCAQSLHEFSVYLDIFGNNKQTAPHLVFASIVAIELMATQLALVLVDDKERHAA